jgi:hypothetical protein
MRQFASKSSAHEITDLSEERESVGIRSWWRDGASRLLFFGDEADADFRAIDPDQFASSKCQACG